MRQGWVGVFRQLDACIMPENLEVPVKIIRRVLEFEPN